MCIAPAQLAPGFLDRQRLLASVRAFLVGRRQTSAGSSDGGAAR